MRRVAADNAFCRPVVELVILIMLDSGPCFAGRGYIPALQSPKWDPLTPLRGAKKPSPLGKVVGAGTLASLFEGGGSP